MFFFGGGGGGGVINLIKLNNLPIRIIITLILCIKKEKTFYEKNIVGLKILTKLRVLFVVVVACN